MTSDLRSRAVRGLSWTTAEAVLKYGMNFVVLLVLARLLTPAEFGVAALLMPIKTLAGELISVGIPAAIIQKKELTPSQISTAFWFQSGMALLVATAVALSGPWVAQFYSHGELDPMLKVTALSMVIGAASSTASGQLQRELRLQAVAQINVFAFLVSGVAAIALAFQGYGAWSIVIQGLLTQVLVTLGVWAHSRWKPAFSFKLDELKEMLRFGGYMFGLGIFALADQRMFSLLIGRQFGLAELGFFNRASGLSTTPLNALHQITSRVTYPVFSAVQDDPERMKRGVREVVRATTLLQAPAMLGLAAVAAPAIEVLFGATWLPSAPLVPAFCVFALFAVFHSPLAHTLMALGKPGLVFRLGFIRSVLYIAALLIAAPHGVATLAWALTVVCVCHLILLLFENQRLLGYGFRDFIADVGSALSFATIMAVVVYMLEALLAPMLHAVFRLILEMAAGALIYGGLWATFDRQSLIALGKLLRSGRPRQREA